MQKTSSIESAITRIVALCCLSMLTAVSAVADSSSDAPPLEPDGAEVSDLPGVEHDTEVTPAGCTGDCCGDQCRSGGSAGKNCCCCKAVCCPRCVTEEVKNHCWLVKSKLVCIPRFQFNLFCDHKSKDDACCGGGCACQKCSQCAAAPCGRVRCINVLEKHEYKCEKCGYEWDVKCVRTGNKCCRGKRCSCPSCGKGCGQCAELDPPANEIALAAAEQLPVTAN